MARYRTNGPNRWFTFQGVEIYPDGDDGWITPKDTTLLNGGTATAAQVEAAMISAGLVSDDVLRAGQGGVAGFVVSASAPVDADGRPDGTVYIQTA